MNHEKQYYREPTDEETFQEYFYGLDLKPEDFDKKILDIGSGSAQFAKWAKEHKVSSNIFSLDPNAKFLDKTNVVKGRVQELPFKNESFDLVLSHGSIPQIFSGAEYEGKKEGLLKGSLVEMIRVAKNDGEIRFGPVIDKKLIDQLHEIFEREEFKGIKIEENVQGGKIFMKIKKVKSEV